MLTLLLPPLDLPYGNIYSYSQLRPIYIIEANKIYTWRNIRMRHRLSP